MLRTDNRLSLILLCVGMATVLFVALLFFRMLRPSADREIAAACAALKPAPTNSSLGKLPTAAPSFVAQDQAGKMVSLEDFRGKITLVNFWASWCNVCALEKPTLRRLAGELGDKIEIVTLASDEDWAEIEALFPQGPPFRVLLDPPADGGNIGRVARSFGVSAVPESFLIDRDGTVRYYYVNKRDWSSSVAQTCLESIADGGS